MALSFLEHFRAARRVSTPLIAVQTPDPAATVGGIATDDNHKQTPMILWNSVQGCVGVNGLPAPGGGPISLGAHLAKALWKENDPLSMANPVDMLIQAQKMSPKSILFMSNLHRYWDAQVIQAVWNLRDQFKQNTRTLVILCPSIKLPAELAQDVLVLDEPLPSAEDLAAVVGETYSAANAAGAKIPMPNNDTVTRCVDALCGLAQFAAEQVSAMSITKTGMNIDMLWERKRQQIEQTPGLAVWRGNQRFKDIGGCDNVKKFLTLVMNGKERPRAIVFQDEIEKQFAGGTGGDLSGTTQELLGNQLTFMQDHDSNGVLSIGHPGVAKSDIAKAFGNEAGIPTIQLDLGNAKGSLVGESNANMRTILKVIEAVSQGRALWIATCNDINGLPPELRSRYTFGTFFYDLPTTAERALIWNIYFEKYGITDRAKPYDGGWNGREIKNCCRLAHDLQVPLKEAATFISPMSTSAPERISNLRKEADGRYISAAYAGNYKMPAETEMEIAEQPPELIGVAVIQRGRRKIEPDPTSGAGGKGKAN